MTSITPIAHRLRLDAEANGVPGNTLQALEMLLGEFPNAAFETDVRLTRHGLLLTFHDVLLDRLTNAIGWVNAIDRRELATIKVKSNGIVTDQSIPELEDIFRLAGGRGRMNLELKSGPGDPPGLLDKVLALLKKYPEQWVAISSFDHRILLDVPLEIPISVLSNSVPTSLEDYLEQFLRTGRSTERLAFTGEVWNMPDEAIAALKRLGIAINAYVVLPQCFEWATTHGVNPITDHMAEAMRFVAIHASADASGSRYSKE